MKSITFMSLFIRDSVCVTTYRWNFDTVEMRQKWHVRLHILRLIPSTATPSIGCQCLHRDSGFRSKCRFDWPTKRRIRKTGHHREGRVAAWHRCSTTGMRRPCKSSWMCSGSSETAGCNFDSWSCQDRTAFQCMLQKYDILKYMHTDSCNNTNKLKCKFKLIQGVL